jgi:hypothetical protein
MAEGFDDRIKTQSVDKSKPLALYPLTPRHRRGRTFLRILMGQQDAHILDGRD